MPAPSLIAFTPELRPSLPPTHACKDYADWRQQLERIDLMLPELEAGLVQDMISNWLKTHPKSSVRQQQNFERHALRAIRCELLRTLAQLDYRQMSVQLADSRLFQWFCRLEEVDGIQAPSKSTLQRYTEFIEESQLSSRITEWLARLANSSTVVITREALDFDTVFIDTTCLKTFIHFPVDWVLLRDGVRTLTKAILVIRDHGLKHRMPAPESFLREINRLSIQMTQARRTSDAKKNRKRALRAMKKQVQAVEEHAKRYRDLLTAHWKEETDLSVKEVQQIVGRIQGILDQLPQAVKQAHERIIGERQVNNADKILSLYETDTQVLVRGKAGAEVEFGNKLLLSETVQGLIVDWELFQDSVPADSQLLQASLQRTEKNLKVEIGKAVTDRGFDSQHNQQFLDREEIFNGMCPRGPSQLKKRMEEKGFAALQKRRSQTEARIGIFKNVFLGQPLRAKGFENRKRAVAWAVLTHNLWVLARMEWKEEEAKKAA